MEDHPKYPTTEEWNLAHLLNELYDYERDQTKRPPRAIVRIADREVGAQLVKLISENEVEIVYDRLLSKKEMPSWTHDARVITRITIPLESIIKPLPPETDLPAMLNETQASHQDFSELPEQFNLPTKVRQDLFKTHVALQKEYRELVKTKRYEPYVIIMQYQLFFLEQVIANPSIEVSLIKSLLEEHLAKKGEEFHTGYFNAAHIEVYHDYLTVVENSRN